MRFIYISICLLGLSFQLSAQAYKVNESQVSFFSDAPLENIEAVSSKSESLFDAGTGKFSIRIPISSFEFDKGLMQDHFNKNYLESDKYPDATFEGTLSGYDPAKAGLQKTWAKGTLSIHGVSREIEAEGMLSFQDGKVYLNAAFPIEVSDYEVKIPRLLFYNISNSVEVKISGTYQVQAQVHN